MENSIKYKLLEITHYPDSKINFGLHYEKHSSNYLLWFSRSNNLNDAAEIIGKEIHQDIKKVILKKTDIYQIAKKKMAVGMYPIYLMLKGYALETLLKGCCVLNNEGWKNKFRGHELIKLVKLINLRISTDEKQTLKHLTRFVEWGGRYPTPTEPWKYKDGGWNDENPFGNEEFSINWVLENYGQFTNKIEKIFYRVNLKITALLRKQNAKNKFRELLKDPKELLTAELINWSASPDRKAEEKEKLTTRIFLYHAVFGRISKEIAKRLGKKRLNKIELKSVSERVKRYLKEQGF